MTNFHQSQWANTEFSRDYREQADFYIPFRQEMLRVLRSFCRHFVFHKGACTACDLGCGDGILAHALLQADDRVALTLVDGSEEMLEAARIRLDQARQAVYLRRSFEELMENSESLGRFDLVVSGFAIHHLNLADKGRLFKVLYRHLNPEGWFINWDTVLPDSSLFADWYYESWQQWVNERDDLLGGEGKFGDIAAKARGNPDNLLSPLTDQLAALRETGFQRVECHCQFGLFVLYSGQRPGEKRAQRLAGR